jgi:glutamyl-Q tRNA(Asp) synthetase
MPDPSPDTLAGDESGIIPAAGYRGRFAPSPTGRLHFGSLLTALASYLEACTKCGEWWVRIENLDPPREVKGAAVEILRSLEAFGFEWHGPVLYQSDRFESYREQLEPLARQQLIYPCNCSRKDIAAVARNGVEGAIYPGTCRHRALHDQPGHALRLRTHDGPIHFRDRIQGDISQCLESQFGDIVIRRADGLFAYQLAVVVDDWHQGITHVVRGCDLLHSTTRQIHLQHSLGLPTPIYAHLPLALDATGHKLSKRDSAHPVDPRHPIPSLLMAMHLLGQPAPPAQIDNLDDFWRWAKANWTLTRVPATRTLPITPWNTAPEGPPDQCPA